MYVFVVSMIYADLSFFSNNTRDAQRPLLISPKQIPSINLLLHIVEASVVAISDDGIATIPKMINQNYLIKHVVQWSQQVFFQARHLHLQN